MYRITCLLQALGYNALCRKREEAMKDQHPKVVMLELYMMGRADTFTLERAHTNLDYMPMGVPRAAGILESTPPSEWLELSVPLVTYHSRWAGLTRDDYQWDKYSRSTYARGASYISGVASIPVNPPPSDIALSAYTDDLAYVRKIARLCADNDAQLVLFTSPSPHVMWVDGQPMLLRLQNDLTAEYPDTRYLDMNSLIEPIGLDPNTDYKDELHLNHRGAVKVSKWLATTLAREFQLPDRRSESLADKWNSSLAQYDKVFTSKK